MMTGQVANGHLETALLALSVGLSPVPPKQDGTKAPLPDVPTEDGKTTWLPYQTAPATEEHVRNWYQNGRTGNGLATGFGGVECLEFDCRDTYEEFLDAAGDAGLNELVDRVRSGYEEFTPSGGVHWLYRTDQPIGNTKLAERPDPSNPAKRDVLIETRGRGGFIIIAPSNGTVHPSGGAYTLVSGGLGMMTTLWPDERDALWSLARSFDQIPVKVNSGFKSSPRAAKGQDDGSTSPLDDFNARADWMRDVLSGWTVVYEHGGATKLRRPGKGIGVSASIKDDVLYVFTTSTAFTAGESYTKAGAFCLLEHKGDWTECVKALVAKSYGTWVDDEGKTHPNPRPASAVLKVRRRPVDADQGSQQPDNRPEITITTQEHIVNAMVLDSLRNDPELYRFGYMLATVITDPDPPRGVEYPDGPSPQLNPLDPWILREHMTKAARFLKIVVKGDKAELIPAHPPDFAINAVHKRKVYPGIRPIEGVIEAPTLRPDGSILSVAGYDRATRLYLQPNVQIDPIPDRPSQQDAITALDAIYDLVTDFPFKSDTHKAVWLTGLLTVLGRASFMGPAPLFALDGNAPGSGKTKLADLISIVASSRRMPRSTWPGGENADEEVRKRITSLVVQGERFVLLDNVDCELGGGPLDAAMTGDTWKDRLLGTNTTVEVPMKMIWFASGNNLAFRGDFVRRAMLSRLETPLEKPEERTGFTHPELLDYAVENRGRILRAALLILRAHRANGRPKLVEALGSFEKWTHAIVDPVRWVTGLNPFDVRADVRVSDKGTQTRAALVEGWAELKDGTVTGLTVADALRQLKDDDDDARKDKRTARFQVLRNALADLTERGDLPSARSIGRYLGGMRGRVVGGKMLRGFEVRSGVYAWKVVDANAS